MTQPHETRPTQGINTMLLQHDGKKGTYAVEIEETWLQEIDHDPTITGKTLAQFALQRKLTGLIIPDSAIYSDVLQSELKDHSPTESQVVVHQLETSSYRSDRLQDLGFLNLVANAIVGRHSQLGAKVGIVRPPLAESQTATSPYSGVPVMTSTGYIINGYEIKNNVTMPKPAINHATLSRTHVASGRILR